MTRAKACARATGSQNGPRLLERTRDQVAQPFPAMRHRTPFPQQPTGDRFCRRLGEASIGRPLDCCPELLEGLTA